MQGPFAFPGEVALTFTRVAILVVCWVALIICVLRDLFLFYQVMDEVNARLPEGERISPTGWPPGKRWSVVREYRRLYPTAPRLRQLRVLGFIFVPILVTAMLAFGIGPVIVGVFGLGASVANWLTYRDNGPVPPPIEGGPVDRRP